MVVRHVNSQRSRRLHGLVPSKASWLTGQLPYVSIFDVDGEYERLTWFVSAFVLQFSIQKNSNRTNVIVDHLIVTVHETKPIPPYRPLMGVYPAEVSLYYVEIDGNNGTIAREFVPSRYYSMAVDDNPETQQYPPPIVLDDNVPGKSQFDSTQRHRPCT